MIFFLILGMTIITFSIRLLSVIYSEKIFLNDITKKFFSLIPIAVLSSICAPLIFLSDNKITNPFYSLEFWTCVVTILTVRYGAFFSVTTGLTFYFILFFLIM